MKKFYELVNKNSPSKWFEKYKIMKRLRFRAWSIKDNEMIYLAISQLSEVHLFVNNRYWSVFDGKKRICGNTDNSGHLMHATGFKDKHGKMIYEGDIISDWTNADEGPKQSFQQVFWNEFTGSWHVDESFEQDKGCSTELWLALNDFKYEITGNIYEKKG